LDQFEHELDGICQNIEIIGPHPHLSLNDDIHANNTDLEDIRGKVHSCIEKCLTMYGNGRQQYQGFYWCNYEHETNKKQTYPCEGDFVCQLYHALNSQLPESVKIVSEVQPEGTRNRIDLVVSSTSGDWAIPIDVKMNWDQFKHKYDQKTGNLKTPEAELITGRYKRISGEYKSSEPITVVIQGALAQATDKKTRSVKIFQDADFPHLLVYYDEHRRMETWTQFSPI